MGYTLTANNSKYSFDGGMGGFMSLRTRIAKAYDEEFGAHYATLTTCWEQKQFDAFNEKSNQILSDKRFKDEDADILDFLFASDCGGKISYRTCNKIYNLIKDIDFGEAGFIYTAYSDGKDYEHLKDFLKECYSNRRNAYWH